ncbi:unnamed protein product [Orchesella dallaii]|uniref:Methyl farnesoate epoxidase n=1 Tax=Orchesella dallaii TaxID=48710 RepID=A0ABP1Q7H7_9HEXA
MIILLLVSYYFGNSGEVSPYATGLVVAIVGLFWFWRRYKAKKRLGGLKELPGPRGLPLVGNIFQLGKFGNAQFCKWTEKYGNIYQVKLGNQSTVVISDPKLTKEIFSNDAVFTGRFVIPSMQFYDEHPGLGIFSSEGELWETHRRFLLRQLRDFGFGKSAMETLIMEEVQETLQRFMQQVGKPVSQIRQTFRLAVVNSLWTILTSQRFNQDDPKLIKLAFNTTQAINDVIESGSLVLFLPWLRHIIPKLSGYTKIREIFQENRVLIEDTIDKHKKSFKEEDLNDFIDVYLAEVRKTTDSTSPFYGEAAERQLAVSLFDLFFAGSDTTATTISWIILLLSKHPEVQQKLQKEIDEITGSSRKVSVTDRPQMPYMQALIDETLRFSTITPDGVQHRALADSEFHGYFIPKDVLIQPNLYYIHHSKAIWGDPENFRPERFLSSDGKTFIKNDNLQAFQVGRRQCVGETLARDTLFLYTSNIFQQFSIELDPNSVQPSISESEVGFLRAPLPYTVIMKDRLEH